MMIIFEKIGFLVMFYVQMSNLRHIIKGNFALNVYFWIKTKTCKMIINKPFISVDSYQDNSALVIFPQGLELLKLCPSMSDAQMTQKTFSRKILK